MLLPLVLDVQESARVVRSPRVPHAVLIAHVTQGFDTGGPLLITPSPHRPLHPCVHATIWHDMGVNNLEPQPLQSPPGYLQGFTVAFVHRIHGTSHHQHSRPLRGPTRPHSTYRDGGSSRPPVRRGHTIIVVPVTNQILAWVSIRERLKHGVTQRSR